jgi:hypothetical protein
LLLIDYFLSRFRKLGRRRSPYLDFIKDGQQNYTSICRAFPVKSA